MRDDLRVSSLRVVLTTRRRAIAIRRLLQNAIRRRKNRRSATRPGILAPCNRAKECDMPLNWFCPLDCSICREPACAAEGCIRTGQPVLAACEGCGTLFLAGVFVDCSDCRLQTKADRITQRNAATTRSSRTRTR
jgi:hypothetical protein